MKWEKLERLCQYQSLYEMRFLSPLVPFISSSITVENQLYQQASVVVSFRVCLNYTSSLCNFHSSSSDPNVDIHSLDIPVNAVATALKGFFSELNEALIPSYLHNEMIEAASKRDRRERITAIREVMQKLPKVNWQVLNFLVDHINKWVSFLFDLCCLD